MSTTQQQPIDTGVDPRPEAARLVDGMDLSGKTVLVTGGYSGIGLETVKALVGAGAHVHVPARDMARARTALDGVIDAAHIGQMDLGDLTSVDKFADDFLAQHQKLDLLIGNAGIMACPMAHTAQGFESQIGGQSFRPFSPHQSPDGRPESGPGRARGGIVLHRPPHCRYRF